MKLSAQRVLNPWQQAAVLKHDYDFDRPTATSASRSSTLSTNHYAVIAICGEPTTLSSPRTATAQTMTFRDTATTLIKEQLMPPARTHDIQHQQLVKGDSRKLQRPLRMAVSLNASKAGSRHLNDCMVLLDKHRPRQTAAQWLMNPRGSRAIHLITGHL